MAGLHLWRQFVLRDIGSRFAGSLLGGAWVLLNPVALLLVYGFVFSAVFRVRLPLGDDTPFLLFVSLAMWPWQAFGDALMRAQSAITGNAALVSKVRFHHALLVHAAVAGSFGLQLAGYTLALLLMALWGFKLAWQGLPLALLCLLALYLLATGLALVVASLNVFMRDVEQVLPPLLAMVFYLSPVLYSSAMVPDWLQGLMLWNPLVPLFDGLRAALLQGQWQPAAPQWVALGVAALVCGLGHGFFHRLSPHFEEAL